MIQKKYLLLMVVALVLIFVVGVAIYISVKSDGDQYQLVESSSADAASQELISLDISAYPNLLNESGKQEITKSILKRTSYDIKKIKSATGIVRKGSLAKPAEFEQTFIVDVKEIQTSYLVSLYKEEDVNIINILCVPKEQQIYSKDYCYEA